MNRFKYFVCKFSNSVFISKYVQKRKFVDTLGPEWSNEELECFYEAYRKYGRDWKKVGPAVIIIVQPYCIGEWSG